MTDDERLAILLPAAQRAHDLIGNDTDNIGAVLDAWVILGDALRKCSDSAHE